MRIADTSRPVIFLLTYTLLVGCSKSEVTGPPVGCGYSTPYGCWACEDSPFCRDYKIGCRRVNDCAIFCGALPEGFEQCHSDETGGFCTDKPLPVGTFEV
ncbi:MAG: hypothetical protein JRH20_26790, partial [Deltaproteobacteria bacterium]|nr:hypothetical protein [Deltaproteobacteria bacterium]